MLRLHLPPNFAAAAARNAVPLRVEVDATAVPPTELLPVLILLQRWCGTPTPPKFIQLSRAQLRELAAAAGPQPIFVETGRQTAWRFDAAVAEPKVESAVPGGLQRPQAVADGKKSPPGTASSTSNGRMAQPAHCTAANTQYGRLTIDGSEHFLAITLPSREHPRYDAAVALLKESGFALEPSNRKWWLRDRHKTLNFLAAHLTTLEDNFGAVLTPNFEKNTAHIRMAEVATTVERAGAGFSVDVGVRAGETNPAEIRSAVSSSRGYVEANGAIYLLDRAKLDRLAAAQRALTGDPNAPVAPQRTIAVSAARIAEVHDILEQLSPNFQPPEAWRQRSAALRNLSTLQPAPIPPDLDAILRPYQKLGVAWLWHLRRQELGGILADEMGLGKTLQALALLRAAGRDARLARPRTAEPAVPAPRSPTANAQRPESFNVQPSAFNATAPAAVICPASLLENWRREAARFTPELRVFVHHGERRLGMADDFRRYDLVITSYGTLTRDQELFAAVEFGCVIADEAQHIKNRRSQNAAALRALNAPARFLLTGTPVENSLEDLRSLFEFLLPGYLTRVPAGTRGEEKAWYDERLRAQTGPYILRRTKKSVAPELPDKIEQVVWCELSPAQAALYRETQERSERELIDLEAGGASDAKLKFAALTQLLRLRQICCDPRLVGGADERLEGESAKLKDQTASKSDRSFGFQPSTLDSAERSVAADSAKLDAFRELLEEAVDDGHRILVFSQFTSLLALLREELDAQKMAYCYLDGSMPARARMEQVDRFQSNADIPLFLLSLKAGGTGLNLTGADTVVIYDPWWNPAAETQAMDRAHRIGQTRTVASYKLIAAGTVEEKVLALQQEKRALLADIFEASDAAAAKLSLADLKELLR